MAWKHTALATTTALAISAYAANSEVAAAQARVLIATDANVETVASEKAATGDVNPRNFGKWGYDRTAMDPSVKPGDDFDIFASGAWKGRTKIPADQSSASVGWDIRKVTEGQLLQIITSSEPESQLGALYSSFIDKERVETLGVAPLQPRLDAITALPDRAAFTRDMGRVHDTFGGSLIEMFPFADPNDPTVSSLFVITGGLGLPDRDYYLEERFANQRQAYRVYLERIFTMVGQADPSGTADGVMAFETSLATVKWSAADLRDLGKLNNPMTLAELVAYAPEIEWSAFFASARVPVDRKIIVTDNSAVVDVAKVYAATPLPVLKAWQAARAVHEASPFLSDEFVQSRFAFTKVLSGASELRPRWTRAVQLIDTSLGELLGQTYVEKHFTPSSKTKMEEMVVNLKIAMAARIRDNDWMAPETKQAGLAKLAKMDVMVGYPDKFRDYSQLELKPDDLLGNVARVGAFNWDYESAMPGKPVDKTLWDMTPQTMDAYNGPFENKIVFPAGILQPPMFSLIADDAVNYGAIGAVIGHEIAHGFDDQGRTIDEDGRLRDWWTPQDAERFDAKAEDFGAQYAEYEPVPGHFINPKLTMGENIADMVGLQVSLDAYRLFLNGKPAPVIDGLTGEQRFFLAYAQAWQSKQRDEVVVQQLASDPHSPARFRVLGPLRNIDAWYEAFGIGPDSKMYIAPENRVKIW